MVKLETFSVWIFASQERHCSPHQKINYIFSEKKPCNLPKSGFVYLKVCVDKEGQHLTGIEADYVYGPCHNDIIITKYSSEELFCVEKNLVGEGSLVDRIIAQIIKIPLCQQRSLVEEFSLPCYGNLLTTLIYLFVFQLAITLVVIAWLDAPCFWENKLLPLYVRLPTPKGFVTRKLLKLLVLYFVYLFSMDNSSCPESTIPGITIELRPILGIILRFIDTWDEVLITGQDLEDKLLQAQLNLGFIKYIIWQLNENKKSCCNEITDTSCHPKIRSESTICTKKDYDSSFVTGDSLDCREITSKSSFVTGDSCKNNSLSTTTSSLSRESFDTINSSLVSKDSLNSSFTTQDVVKSKHYTSVSDLESGYCETSAVDAINSSLITEDDLRPISSTDTSSIVKTQTTSFDKANNRAIQGIPENLDIRQTYQLLESKKRELEKKASQVNQSLAAHFTTLSHEVVGYAMTEVRQRLEGCIEEHIYKSYPRIESYIQAALRDKSDYFFLLKEQLDLEVSRVRDVCQQAFLVLEAVPQYEERIRHLENEVKALKGERNGETDLHRKVEHLQSTVSQLLRAVRCRA